MDPGLREVRLHRLALYQFKCYPELQLDFEKQVVCLLGHNGAGKTNLLDAIHYLAFCKSYFNSVDAQNIRTGGDACSISGEFTRGGMPESIHVAWKRNQRKTVRRNQKEYERLSSHIGLLPAVIITPYDTDLVLEGSETRRRFLDGTLSQVDPVYLEHLVRYGQALQQRNTLLRQMARSGSFSESFFESWDYQLELHATPIHERRKAFFDSFSELFRGIYGWISGSREAPELHYETDMADEPLSVRLRAALPKDRALERTTCGVHKDDISFLLDGLSLKRFGSQGQQKSFLISLKLAQLLYLRNTSGWCPILMLDDLFDKLDEERVWNLLRWLRQEHPGQLFITDTHLERIPQLLTRLEMSFEAWEIRNASALRIS